MYVYNQLSYGLIPLRASEYDSIRSEQREHYLDCAFVIFTRQYYVSVSCFPGQINFENVDCFRDARTMLSADSTLVEESIDENKKW